MTSPDMWHLMWGLASYDTQDNIDQIVQWTDSNLMKLNAAKCNYMIFSRSGEQFTTRLSVKGTVIDRIRESKILGLWISDTLSWARNCTEICKQAYSRLAMITRLKYVGVAIEDLLDIYKLFIRSVTEYCSVVFHSRLTQEQSEKLERIQKACLRVILGDMYLDYTSALEMTGLETLVSRRIKRCLDFSKKCIKHPRNSRLFPIAENNSTYNVRRKDMFKVNFARTSSYQNSTIPFCQRLLNKHFN